MLFLLERTESGARSLDGHYDVPVSFVISAPTGMDARRLAFDMAKRTDEGGDLWLDADLTTCVRINDNASYGYYLF